MTKEQLREWAKGIWADAGGVTPMTPEDAREVLDAYDGAHGEQDEVS